MREFEAHLAETFRIVAPVFTYLDEKEEVDRLFQDFRQFLARSRGVVAEDRAAKRRSLRYLHGESFQISTCPVAQPGRRELVLDGPALRGQTRFSKRDLWPEGS